MRPRELFELSARSVAVAWALLIVGLILKYLTQTTSLGVRIFVPVLLALFVVYAVVTLALWTNHRWHTVLLLRALAAAVVPFGTLWFLRWAKRRRELSGDWRLGRNGSYAYTWNERLLAWGMRRPGLAIFLLGVALAMASAIYWRTYTTFPLVGS